MITTTDKVHLKCDCVGVLIANGVREETFLSFNLSASLGYKIIKKRNNFLYEKINKTQLVIILEDSTITQ